MASMTYPPISGPSRTHDELIKRATQAIADGVNDAPLPQLFVIADDAALIDQLVEAERLDRSRVTRLDYSEATLEQIRKQPVALGSVGSRSILAGWPCGGAQA